MSAPVAAMRLGGGALRAGEDRLRLLEAIGELGSITGAAQRLGLSYRGAWDAVQALNNLFEKPLVAARSGGAAGGSARLTREGEAALATLRHVQAEMNLALERLAARMDTEAPGGVDPWRLVMRTSARNALRGVVSAVTEGAVDSEVALSIAPGLDIVAILTRRSVADLALAPGVEAIALIKASFVILAAGAGPWRTSARNTLAGVVAEVEEGAVNTEVTLEIAEGKTLTAIVTRASADALDLKPGDPAAALIKASHVILAIP